MKRPPLDIALIASFSLFAVTSFAIDPYVVFGVDLASTTDLPGRGLYSYASSWDPLLLEPSLAMRVMFAIDAFVFGPFYLVLVYALWRRRPWIRVPALMYAAAMLYSMAVYDALELVEHVAGTRYAMVFAIGAPYTVMALLLIVRMRRPNPFGGER